MSKPRHARKLTGNEKPSVFERLGSKSSKNKVWDDHGGSSIGEATKVLKGLSVLDSLVGSEVEMKKSSHGKKGKEKHRKHNPPAKAAPAEALEAPAWDSLDLGDLEGADEKFLQKRRLQLQRELRLQLKREKSSSKKAKKVEKKASRAQSTSSASSSESSSSSSSSSSSYQSKRNLARKRKASPSSESDESSHVKKRKSPKLVPKPKVEVKKKAASPRKVETPRKHPVVKKSVTPESYRRASPESYRRASPPKKKSPPRSKGPKPRPPSPKHKVREPSPRRPPKPKERRPSPPRVTRPRTPPDRRHRHSPRPRHGGLEKGGKILPVKSSAYVKEMKESIRRKTPERLREDKEKEKERLKEKRRREQTAREEERRDREREAERVKREAARQKDREEALQRCRERQRERERTERQERDVRDKRKDFERKEESRKPEVKSELPSLLDIKTEAPPPREPAGRRGWEERRGRRPDDTFDFRRHPREDIIDAADDRRGSRKGHDYLRGEAPWEGKEEFREPPPGGEWSHDWNPRSYEPKWGLEGGREREGWRGHYTPGRRPPDWRTEAPPVAEPRLEDRPSVPVVDIVAADAVEVSGVVVAPAEPTADLKEVLSDISDDPDDILNQVDEPVPEPAEEPPKQLIPVSLTQPSAEFFFDSRRPLLECLGDRGLDFEEISDEELEEEAKMSKGIMDVLGADWASLMTGTRKEPQRVEAATSARRRWRVDCIIARIGISRSLAGEEFTDKYLARIQSQGQEADQTAEKKASEVKEEPGVVIKKEVIEDGEMDGDVVQDVDKGEGVVKEEPERAETKEPKQWKLLHPLPAVHSLLAELPDISPVSRLLNPTFKHALSARTDLAIRRVLCGLSPKEPLQLAQCEESLQEASVALFKSHDTGSLKPSQAVT